MKRKSELSLALDEMFAEDDKKRINAIKKLESVAIALGAQRTRDQLVPFLTQFWNDESEIMSTVVREIGKLKPYLGGIQHEKLLLPVLIGFCQSDEMDVAMEATKIMVSIISMDSSQCVDVVKKLAKTQMDVTKHCIAILLIWGIQKIPNLTSTFMEIYKSMVFSQKPSVRIIASKYLKELSQKIAQKDQIISILDMFYNDSEDLTKLYTIETLISLYSLNPNFIMSRLKYLLSQGNWRINMKICECGDLLRTTLSKSHFKIFIQPAFFNMMNQSDIQIKAKSCYVLLAIAQNMTTEETQTKLLPILTKIVLDNESLVKINLCKNIMKLLPYFSQNVMRNKILPIIIGLLNENNIQLSIGIIENLKDLPQQLKNREQFQKLILKPLSNQLTAKNWRLKSSMLTVLGKTITQRQFLVPTMIDIFINGCFDRIEAIRNLSVGIIIEIIKIHDKQWCKTQIIPKLTIIQDSKNYLARQKVLVIIKETVDSVDQAIIEKYRNILQILLNDKIPNVRMIALDVLISQPKLTDKTLDIKLGSMKDDSDQEIRKATKMIQI